MNVKLVLMELVSSVKARARKFSSLNSNHTSFCKIHVVEVTLQKVIKSLVKISMSAVKCHCTIVTKKLCVQILRSASIAHVQKDRDICVQLKVHIHTL